MLIIQVRLVIKKYDLNLVEGSGKFTKLNPAWIELDTFTWIQMATTNN